MYKTTIKNFTKFFCFLIVIFFISINAIAQGTPSDGFKAPDFTPKSPEAAAFLKYGEYPVDLSTGVPSISLPIYSIKVDDLEIPISLSYHASGIKVNQEATWVGLGWNLNAGAQIILNSRDNVDEDDAGIDGGQRNPALIRQFMTDHPYAYNNSLLQEYEKSRVKDVYSFSSPTVNGSFYIDNGIPIIFPPDAFAVELIGTNSSLHFTITDKFGNKYLFKSTIEKSERVMTHHDDYISAWYVDEIVTPKNNKIKFTYQDDGDVIEYSESESIGVTEEGKNCGCYDATKTQTVGTIRKSNESTITSTKKIKEITFNDDKTKVEFELVQGRLDLVNQNGFLKTVKVSQGDADGFTQVKKVTFEYSYFNDSKTGTDAYKYKRLKLDRIYEWNDANEHSFIYSDIELPIKDSKSQDYYGYYNGAFNISLIPKHIITTPEIKTVGSADREINSGTIQAGILKEIHYPTKGFSRFNYETNKFYGIDQLKKYVIQKKEISITGISPAKDVAPPRLADIDGEIDFEGQNCSDGNCLKYKGIYFNATNPQSNFLTYTITNNGSKETKDIKYKYCRIYVNINGSVYDSGKINIGTTITLPLNMVTGSYSIILESYGADMRIDATLNYTEVDLTPKNLTGSGLRIQNIESYNYDNTLLLKKAYEYNDKDNNTISSGKLINNLGVDFISNTFANFVQGICPVDMSGNLPNGAILPRVDYTKGYYINSRSKQGAEANSVVYKYVREIFMNTALSENMYSDYEFTIDPDWSRSDIGVQANLGWKRGKVLEKKDFKTVGSNSYVVRKEKNTYFEDNAKIAYIKGYKLMRRSYIDVTENTNPQEQPPILSVLSDCQVPQGLSSSYVLADYNIPIPWFYQKTSEISNYFYNASNSLTGTVVSTTNFNYSNPSHLQLTSQTTTSSIGGETLETKYLYASDPEMAGKPFVNELKAANMIGIPLDIKTLKGGTKTSEQLTTYDKSTATGNLLLPRYVYVNKGAADINLSLDRKIVYDKYDEKGNLLQYTTESGIPFSIIWGYNKTQPIAKIENLVYSAIPVGLITTAQNASDTDIDIDTNLLAALTALRTDSALANAMVTGFTYKPLIGVSSIVDPKGYKTSYEYDSANRLKLVRDSKGNILSENQYHYKD